MSGPNDESNLKTVTSRTIAVLLQAFPGFSDRWASYVEFWNGNPPGSYMDMAEFVHFVVEDVYEKGNLDETHRVFQLLEKLLVEAGQETRDLIGLGFFETLQNFASWRPGGNKVYEQFLGPMSKQVWSELQAIWAGKSNLMDGHPCRTKKQVTRANSRKTGFSDTGISVPLR
jgi:hypothetical protein